MNVVYYRMVNAGGYTGGYYPVNTATPGAPLPGTTPPTPGTGLGGPLTPAAPGGALMPKLVFPSFSSTQIQYMFRPKLGRMSKVNKSVRCETCAISLNSEQQAQQHYSGKNHLKKLKQAQGEKTGKTGKRRDKDKEKGEGEDKDDETKSKDDDEATSQRSSTSRSSSPATTATQDTENPNEEDMTDSAAENTTSSKGKDKDSEEEMENDTTQDEENNSLSETSSKHDSPGTANKMDSNATEASTDSSIVISNMRNDHELPSDNSSHKRCLDEGDNADQGTDNKKLKSEHSVDREATPPSDNVPGDRGNVSASSNTSESECNVKAPSYTSDKESTKTAPTSVIVSSTPKPSIVATTTTHSSFYSSTSCTNVVASSRPAYSSKMITSIGSKNGLSRPTMTYNHPSRSTSIFPRSNVMNGMSSLSDLRAPFLSSPAASLQGSALHGTTLASLQGRPGFLAYLPPGSAQYAAPDQQMPSQNALVSVSSAGGLGRVTYAYANPLQSPALQSGPSYNYPFTYPSTPSDMGAIPRVLSPLYSPSLISPSPMTPMLAGQSQLASVPMATNTGRTEDSMPTPSMLNSYHRMGLMNQALVNGLSGSSVLNQSVANMNNTGVINQNGTGGSSFQDVSYHSYGASVEALSVETVNPGSHCTSQYQLPSPYDISFSGNVAVAPASQGVQNELKVTAQPSAAAGTPKLDPVSQAVYDNMLGKLPTKRKLDIPCEVCDMIFNSEVQAHAHFKGIKHAKRAKMAEEAKEKGENGVTHRKSLARTGSVTPPSRLKSPPATQRPSAHSSWGEVPGQQTGWFHCTICDISVPTAASLQHHVIGPKHIANKERQTEGQRLSLSLNSISSH